MSLLGLPLLLVVFVVAAASVWLAGIRLLNTTDVLAAGFGLGQALGGLLLLAVATLPEIAITASAALRHDLGIAIGNILGGIAIQTVVLVALDAFGIRGGRPLTYRAASLQLMPEGALVVAVLVIATMGIQLPSSLIVGRVAPSGLLIVIVWVVGIGLLGRARKGLPWLAGGMLLEESGTRIADHIGMSGVLFGSTVLAASTACPRSRRGSPRSSSATTTSPSQTSSAVTPSSPSCSSWPACSRAARCCPRRRPPTSTSPGLGEDAHDGHGEILGAHIQGGSPWTRAPSGPGGLALAEAQAEELALRRGMDVDLGG